MCFELPDLNRKNILQVYKFPFDKQDCYYCFIMFNYNAKNELRFNAKIAPRAYIYVSIYLSK